MDAHGLAGLRGSLEEAVEHVSAILEDLQGHAPDHDLSALEYVLDVLGDALSERDEADGVPDDRLATQAWAAQDWGEVL